MHHRVHRQLDTRWDEHGCLEIRARLTAEQGAVVLKALEAAVESLKEAEPTKADEPTVNEVKEKFPRRAQHPISTSIEEPMPWCLSPVNR